jgi:hypothetical protein
MLWVFTALACDLNADGPDHEYLGGSGEDSSVDADGDGYDASVDCDDREFSVHPGANETCGNGRDDNCNGTSDGCDWAGELVLEGTEITTSNDRSDFATSLAVCDANGDGIGDVVGGAPRYDETGAVYVFYGPISTDHDAKGADYTLLGTERRLSAGVSVDCRRDIDGDATADIVVGAPTSDRGGKVYVVPGGGTGSAPLADEASTVWIGSDPREFGHRVLAIEVDGDETEDLAVALGPAVGAGSGFGRTYVFDEFLPGEHDADAAAAYIQGGPGDPLDPVVGSAGDLDGDGLEEIVVAGNDAVVSAALVFHSPLSGVVPKSDADLRIVGGPTGNLSWDAIGHTDLDDDGRDDLFLANPNRDDFDGAAYVFLSPIRDDTSTAAAELRISGSDHEGAGSAMTSPGDVDGDGTNDLLIGAAEHGTVYLVYGGDPGVYLLEKDAQAWWRSKETRAKTGAQVGAGDVTGDGIVELLIASPRDGEDGEGTITVLPSFEI